MVASYAAPTGDPACNTGMCPDWELNWWPFGLQAGAQSTQPHQPGLQVFCFFKLRYITYTGKCIYLKYIYLRCICIYLDEHFLHITELHITEAHYRNSLVSVFFHSTKYKILPRSSGIVAVRLLLYDWATINTFFWGWTLGCSVRGS